jgi:ribonuclease HI
MKVCVVDGRPDEPAYSLGMRFTCGTCGKDFTVAEATLKKYPGWKPKVCFSCKNGGKAASREENLTLAQVLEKYHGGPTDGVFTDGSCEPNPGPGGWGAVYVSGNAIVAEQRGSSALTTNNRMELTALIAAVGMVPPGVKTTVYTDSQLCVNTINEWAAKWEAKGWKKKGGEIKNLELVQEAFELFQSRPELTLAWIAAHNGNRWNEYADSLASAWNRSVL